MYDGITENLDHSRRVDYAADNKPSGVELLSVHRGVNLDELPEQGAIADPLNGHGVKVFV